MATTFGATQTFDAFVAAFRLPDLFFNLVVIGALSASFIPFFTDKLVRGGKNREARAFAFATTVLNTVLLVISVLCAVYAVLAPLIVPLITPGFSPEAMRLTVTLSRIMALQPPLLAISFVFSGILNSYKKFLAYALAPIFYNVGIIVGIVVLAPDWGIAGVAWGVVIGAVLHMMVQLPSVWRLGFRWRASLQWQGDDVRALTRMMIPRVIGLGGQQFNLVVVTIVGSGLLAGSITAFHLANNVQYLPVGIFGLAFAQAAFPTLAEHVSLRRTREFVDTLTRAFRYILFFIIPLSVFFFLLRAQIVRVLFGDGAFDWEDTILTYETFGWLILSIFAQATIPLLTRAFYVWQDTKTPVIISLVSVVVNAGLAFWLAPRWGVQGLALAFSLSSIVNVVLLLSRLHWQFGSLNDREIFSSLTRIGVAALAGGLVLQLLKYPVSEVVNMQRFWGILAQAVATSSGGAATYLLMCWFLQCEELQAIRKYFPRKLQLLPRSTETPRFSGLPE
jgi:putative peptidoglycan lipid II flippase